MKKQSPASQQPTENLQRLVLDLQERVTRFSIVEQELINTRNKLDGELARQRSIHAFGRVGTKTRSLREFCERAAEHIVSTFEVEVGIFFVFHEEDGTLIESAQVGLPHPRDAAMPGAALANAWRTSLPPSGISDHAATIHSGSPSGAMQAEGLCQAILCPCRDASGHLVALLLGARTLRNASFYGELTEELTPSFTMFSEYAGGILSLLRNQVTIKNQLVKIGHSEELLGLALDGAQLGTWDRNLVTGEAFFNDHWAGMLGLRLNDMDLSREHWDARVHPDDFAQASTRFQDHLSGKTAAYESEYRVRHNDGHWIWILDRGRVMERNASGTPVRICGTHLDISERKGAEAERRKLEQQVQQSQKLESLGVLAGGVAHDFNNILTVIQANADLAKCSLESPKDVALHLDEICRGSKRAAGLANQMLAFAGRGKFVIQSTHLGELVDEMIQLLSVSISKNIQLEHLHLPGNPIFEGDQSQIRQVVMNLIINASEAIDDQSGNITISTSARYFDEDQLATFPLVPQRAQDGPLSAGRYVVLEVSDTGSGMTPDVQKKVFEPFFTTKFTGRGLGMAALLGILGGHRGALRMKSTPGEGTVFTALFPATVILEPMPRQSAPTVQAPVQQSRGTILVVDDESGIRKVATHLLERMGFTVQTACDGRAAVELFAQRSHEIDCVLLDLTMPRMDGEETLRELRKIKPDVRVLLSSGFMEREATERFRSLNLSGYLQKPYSAHELEQKLMSAF